MRTVSATTAQGKTLSRVVVGHFAATALRLARAGVAGLVRQTENL